MDALRTHRLATLPMMLGLTLSAFFVAPYAFAQAPLEPFIWTYRVMLIDAERLGFNPVEQLLEKKTDIDERHIRWFVLGVQSDESGSDVVSNATETLTAPAAKVLRQTYFGAGDHAVVLVGKDGGVKSVDPRLDLTALFALIDGMPMRRQEMKR